MISIKNDFGAPDRARFLDSTLDDCECHGVARCPTVETEAALHSTPVESDPDRALMRINLISAAICIAMLICIVIAAWAGVL